MSAETTFALLGGPLFEKHRHLTAEQAVHLQCYLPFSDDSPQAVLERLVDVVAKTVATLHEKGVLEDFDMVCILDNFIAEENHHG